MQGLGCSRAISGLFYQCVANKLFRTYLDQPFLMHPEHLAGSPVELLEVAKTASASNSNHLLHALPEAFDGVEVVPTAGGNQWNCNCPCQCSRVGASFLARWIPLRSMTITTSFPVLLEMAIT